MYALKLGSRHAFLFVGIAFVVSMAFAQDPSQPQAPESVQRPPNPKDAPIDERLPSTQKSPVPQTDKAPEPGAKGPTAGGGGPSGPGAPVDSSTYKIGPADILLIRVWNEGEFTGPVSVHQDGKFTLPLVGDLDAGGHTPSEVQDTIAKALTKYVVKPLVTVTVQEVGSKRYFMDGLVNRPGEYPLIIPTTILEAISKAGGLQDFANAKKVYVLRGDKRIYFNYKDVLRGKHMDQNILLMPSDHVVAH